MNCRQCEERMSDYLEDALGITERSPMESHFETCASCAELLAGMRDVMAWGREFPVYDVPAWLPSRILANTPRVVRETWWDTVTSVGRWLLEPRTAVGLLTAVLMIGWLGSAAGISNVGDIMTIAENPAGTCYTVYDEAVRAFYRAPLVTEIRSEIERLREIS